VLSPNDTAKRTHPLWTVGILAFVATATLLMLFITSGR
jgi:hypothetical protein